MHFSVIIKTHLNWIFVIFMELNEIFDITLGGFMTTRTRAWTSWRSSSRGSWARAPRGHDLHSLRATVSTPLSPPQRCTAPRSAPSWRGEATPSTRPRCGASTMMDQWDRDTAAVGGASMMMDRRSHAPWVWRGLNQWVDYSVCGSCACWNSNCRIFLSTLGCERFSHGLNV